MSVTAVPLRPIKKGSLVKLWVGIGLLAAAGIAVAWSTTKSAIVAAQTPEEFLAENGKRSGVVTTASGLQYEVLKEGDGAKPTPADLTVVNYEGKLAKTGVTFDASARHGGPATLPVVGLIPGWSEGIQLMKQGAKYRFWMPPNLGYGEQGAGQNGEIPPNAVLQFDLELVAIQPGAMNAMQGMMGGMGGGDPHGGVVPPPTEGM
ncbi:FKBP-type peptidyl-prolyl cis-trans isomerase [Sphingomonas laterariae]|uniref:Peptidyl-prolyl cis-trans isomerase n=1 Tax=Edaphosphingomonas laterariae TaxID=861865 RepID=A0A239IGH2_9SPHN|nr:FKBP-type peptidyl-prolyl cis-trans isomerase [Sphingomonas laterariae]SNS92697.1 FKBP-type peptidyl-prolyl cis-trans isomerase [Sphingomonas laterariae]